VSGPTTLAGIVPEQVIRYLPVAAIVVEAPSGRIVAANPRAREMVERRLGRTTELGPDWESFHPDGRPYDVVKPH
jgi:hypothetical protein